MPAKNEVINAGGSALFANLIGSDPFLSVTSAGANQAAAAPLPGNFCTVTGTGGVILPPSSGQGFVVLNPIAASTVYANGSEQINNIAAGSGLLLTAGRNVVLFASSGRWLAIGSAN